jgi:hypothetical protein
MFCCFKKRKKVHPEPLKQGKVHKEPVKDKVKDKVHREPSRGLHKRADRQVKCCGWEKTDNVGFHHKK